LHWLLLGVGGVILAAAVYALWLEGHRQAVAERTTPDMKAVLEANNQGVGLTEQFKYAEAAAAFEKVVTLAPDWMPGRINLGIALLNTNTAPNIARARELFDGVLRQEPENPYAHFCLGILLRHEGNPDEQEAAAAHFEAVARLDPEDASAWYWLGSTLPPGSQRATECFRRANQLDPHLAGAVYQLAMALRQSEPGRSAAALAEYRALHDDRFDSDTRGNLIAEKYCEMGRYAEVIGGQQPHGRNSTAVIPLFLRNDKLRIDLAPGARWATAADFGGKPDGILRARLRQRFGATMVVLDYNRDGRPDLFLLGAVFEEGYVRDLLLRNEGDGRFTDVTAEAGLARPRPSVGCCVADVDNDSYPDLFITGIGEQRLFRNTGAGRFEDVTARSGLNRLTGVCLGAIFVDLDQDGDLDLIVARYAGTSSEALAMLDGAARPASGNWCVYLNVSEAPPLANQAIHGQEPLLNIRFRPLDQESLFLPAGITPACGMGAIAAAEALARSRLQGQPVPAVSMAAADLDQDRDLDLVLLADRTPPAVVLNDRLLRFHRLPLPGVSRDPTQWNGALVLDTHNDGRSDLFLISPTQRPVLLVNQGATRTDGWYVQGQTDSPPLLQAQAIDLDLDGWTDIVGLSAEHRPLLLHNDGRRLVHAPESLGADRDWPVDVVGLVVADFNGDGFPDLMLWSEREGLQLRESQGNGNHALRLELTGRRGPEPGGVKVRTNADAFGVSLTVLAGDLATRAEATTLSAGLGQSRQPLTRGLGSHAQADVVRLRWPDGVCQAELNVATDQVVRIAETNRKTTSCPLLFAWNGRRFGFVTDFLGAGSTGEPALGGGYRPPRPEESVKIEADQLVPRDGAYVLKVAEPMDEVTYLDRLRLVVIDHPADVYLFPDERFTSSGPPASQDLLALARKVFPVAAYDHRRRDVTRKLASWDRDTVDDFAPRSWLGFAEDHWVELDFGDRLSKFVARDRLFLCLAGWTDYPFPESIWAAAQARTVMEGPKLERIGADGTWRTIIAETGFPAGLPRMMTVDVSGKLGGPTCRLRLRTNLEVYWDQIFVAPLVETVTTSTRADKRSSYFPPSDIGIYTVAPYPEGVVEAGATITATCLDVAAATLSPRPLMKEYSPDGRRPTLYDYDLMESVPVSRLAGRMTRFGDVTKLLREVDDCFVIFGPGDEIEVRFDARNLPPLCGGWTRSFVLRTWGYSKDCTPFSDTGDRIEPLPFRAMRNYPYGPQEHYPQDAMHDDYRRRFNTRLVGPEQAK
jgi:hypothetical protein